MSLMVKPIATENDLTLVEALAFLEEQGFTGQFRTRSASRVQCLSCRTTSPASSVRLEATVRLEGASDPADEMVAAGLVCPACGARGTETFTFGPMAPPEEAQVFHDLDDERDLA